MAAAWRRLISGCISGALFTIAAAIPPEVNYPWHSQSPPVARVGQHFQFQFAPTTFLPRPEELEYALIGNPAWLTMDGRTRTLHGVPKAGDEGTASFIISAADAGGDVAKMPSTLLVTDAQEPRMKANLSDVLSKAGQLSAPDTLILPPLTGFEIGFPRTIFESAGEKLKFRALLADHTPLPAWIDFDASTLRFSGLTPVLESSPIQYNLLLIASEDPGYSSARTTFNLAVSNHEFLFKPVHRELMLRKGDAVSISELRNQLFVDGNRATEVDVRSASADLPSWLKFDNRTLEITGAPPSDVALQDLSVTVTNEFGDIATQTIHLSFDTPQLFTGEIGTLTITPGKPFIYQVSRSLFRDSSGIVSADLGPLSEWLSFDPATLTISGTIPGDASHQTSLDAILTVASNDGSSDSQAFQFDISPQPMVSVLPPPMSEQLSATDETKLTSRPDGALIAGIVVAALAGCMLMAIAVWILCRRRKKSSVRMGYIRRRPRSPRSPKKSDISRPTLVHDTWGISRDKGPVLDLEKGLGVDTLARTALDHPPQIRLKVGPIRKISHSANSSIGEPELKILSSFENSPWGFRDEEHVPHESMKIPTAMARRESDNSELSKKDRRLTAVALHGPDARPGLPIDRLLTESGHDCQAHVSSRTPLTVSGCRRTMSHTSHSTVSTAILSTGPSAAPQQSAARHTMQLTVPVHDRHSIRLVPRPAASTCDSRVEYKRGHVARRSIPESIATLRSIDKRRQSYIRKRASTQSPFFASSSRVSSSTYTSPPAFLNDEVSTPSALSSTAPQEPSEVPVTKAAEELSDSPRIPELSVTPSPPPTHFEGSLRTQRSARSFSNRPSTANSGTTDRGRVYKQYQRPSAGGPVYSPPSSSRNSLRAHELKSSLNSLTGRRIFEDAEMGDNVYSTEEEDIEDYERRVTLQSDRYSALSPLKVTRHQNEKRESRSGSPNVSQNSKRPHTRTSPSPYAFAIEHGGKENMPSAYTLSLLPPAGSASSESLLSRSPERPKTIATTSSKLLAADGQDASEKSEPARSKMQHPRPKALSQLSTNSRKSARPLSKTGPSSRPQSRRSSQKISHSRGQSTAYPTFEMATLSSTLRDSSKPTDEQGDGHMATHSIGNTAISCDEEGNKANRAVKEAPSMERLDDRSIGSRTTKGKRRSSARKSRLSIQHSAPSSRRVSAAEKASKPNAATPPGAPTPAPEPRPGSRSPGLGLELSSLGFSEVPSPEEHTRSPLSMLEDVGDKPPVPERSTLRVIAGKGKRPVSSEVEECLRVGASRKARTGSGWGSWKRVIGREKGGSIDGESCWEGEERGGKMFI